VAPSETTGTYNATKLTPNSRNMSVQSTPQQTVTNK